MSTPSRDADPVDLRSSGSSPTRSANQGKAEPFPPSPSQGDQDTPGQAHPQAPTGDPAGSAGDAAGVPVGGTEPAAGTSQTLPVAQPLHVPELDESGASDR